MKSHQQTQKIFVRLLLGLLALDAFQGQALAMAPPMTFDDCLKEAAANSPLVKSARANLESNVDLVPSARNNYFPQVVGTIGYTYTNNTYANAPLSNAIGPSYVAGVTATENLFNGFQDKAKVEQAEANRDNTKFTLQQSLAQVTYDLRSTFANLRYAQDNVKLTEEITKRRLENLRLVQLRFNGGQENKGSVMLSKANMSLAEFNHLQAMDSVRSAQVDLARVLGRNDIDSLNIVGEVPVSDQKVENLNLFSLVEETPDIGISKAAEDASLASLKITESNFYPTLALTGGIQNYDNTFFPQNNKIWTIGVTLTIPLFNGGRDYYATQGAIESLRSASSLKAKTLHDISAKIQFAYFAYREAIEMLKVNQSFVDAQIIREKIVKANYNNGLSSFTDWDLVETDLIARQTTLLQSRQARTITEAAWEQALGRSIIP